MHTSELQYEKVTHPPETDEDITAILEGWAEEDLQRWDEGLTPTVRFLFQGEDDVAVGTAMLPDLPESTPNAIHVISAVFSSLSERHRAFAGAMSFSVLTSDTHEILYVRSVLQIPLEILQDPSHPLRDEQMSQYMTFHQFGVSQGIAPTLIHQEVPMDTPFEIKMPKKRPIQ